MGGKERKRAPLVALPSGFLSEVKGGAEPDQSGERLSYALVTRRERRKLRLNRFVA